MHADSLHPANVMTEQDPVETVYRLYTALATTVPLDADCGLGGLLLYAGELDGRGRNLLYAANIAGTASLTASADSAVQRQAIRDGVIDFLVTTLEEALRILKNEIRKRNTVSVGVAADPRRLVEQMLDRGVLPDLLPPASTDSETGLTVDEAGMFLVQGARRADFDAGDSEAHGEFVTWSVDFNFPRWLPRLDGCVRAIVPPGDVLRQRWLRLAPRYLGRLVQRRHGVVLDVAEAAHFVSAARALLALHARESSEPETVEIQGRRIS
jgi:hypothetical protein